MNVKRELVGEVLTLVMIATLLRAITAQASKSSKSLIPATTSGFTKFGHGETVSLNAFVPFMGPPGRKRPHE